MVRHVVMFSFLEEAEGLTKEENLLKAKKKLEELPSKISLIKYYEAGINVFNSQNAYDLCLISGFDSWEDLDNYRIHPAHKEAVSFIHSVIREAHSSDYEI